MSDKYMASSCLSKYTAVDLKFGTSYAAVKLQSTKSTWAFCTFQHQELSRSSVLLLQQCETASDML